MTCGPIFGITKPRYPLRGATEFATLRYFALNGTDHRSHDEQNAAVAAYVRWRNASAQPKTNFAVDSPIRTWTSYTVEAA
ncbi:transposase [Pseudonocardia cypriaca]|uniref:transposase n=1 Tax=Pseudonocardia cypriaca TaxID=882449 RepID=UPI0011545672|nr:transposase [Pseudonocardia cypriaca]